MPPINGLPPALDNRVSYRKYLQILEGDLTYFFEIFVLTKGCTLHSTVVLFKLESLVIRIGLAKLFTFYCSSI